MATVQEFVWDATTFEAAGEAGVLPPHADLIDGVVWTVSPQGHRQARVVRALTDAARSVPIGFRVGVQLPVRLSDVTEPEPDLYVTIGPEGRYAERHPSADDLVLVVEVSDTTFEHDTTTKLAAYLAAGVAEVWIVDVNGRQVLRYVGAEVSAVGEGTVRHSCGLAVDVGALC